MIETEPKVYLISRPSVDYAACEKWLEDLGCKTETRDKYLGDSIEDWENPNSQILCELAGRRCYNSFEPGLNPNVTKIRDSSEDYFDNIHESGHGSVLEHAQFTFAFEGVSRVFTHELVRHRVGVAISQESMRYVRMKDIPMWFPPEIKEMLDKKLLPGEPNVIDEEVYKELETVEEELLCLLEHIKEVYSSLCVTSGINETNFTEKKALTSALRRILPMGISTGMVWSANARALRHIIAMRTHPSAEIEMRIVFNKVARIMFKEAPLLFKDIEVRTPEGPVKIQDLNTEELYYFHFSFCV